jgi:serine/threonine-protein kinase
MFALLTGKYVHDARSPMERVILAATKSAPAIRSVVPHLHEDLAHVVDLALSFDREERWASARSMREALDVASRAALASCASEAQLAPSSHVR